MSTVSTKAKVVDPVTDEQRCDLTELIKDQCAHCRQGTRRPRMVDALFDTPGAHVPAYTFRANWPGKCDECGEDFHAGAYVTRTVDGEYLCGWCA